MRRVPLRCLLEDESPEAQAPWDVPLVFPEGFRVLVVDDISINARVLARLLVRLGVRFVDLAFSGKDALAMVERNPPDVAFVDIWMPGMDGVELRRRLVEKPQFASLPVFAVTADEKPGTRFDASGFTGIVKKPVTSQLVSEALRSCLVQAGPTCGSCGK